MINYLPQLKTKSTGFTLVEVMVSISIFTLLVTVGIAALVGMNNAFQKSRAQSATMDNFSFAVESMVREIRVGSDYHCGQDLQSTGERKCQVGEPGFTFTDKNGDRVTYYVDGPTDEGIIFRQAEGQEPVPITGTEVQVVELDFLVMGNFANSQPMMMIQIIGEAKGNQGVSDQFVIQQAVSQRTLDI